MALETSLRRFSYLLFFTTVLSLNASAGVVKHAQAAWQKCILVLSGQQVLKSDGDTTVTLGIEPTYSVRDLFSKDSSLFTANAARDVDRHAKLSFGYDYEIDETFPKIDFNQALATAAELDHLRHPNDIGVLRVVRRDGEWIPVYPMNSDDGITRKYYYLRLQGKLPDIVRLRLELGYQKLIAEFPKSDGFYPENFARILFGVQYDGSDSSQFHFDPVEPGLFVDTIFGRGTVGLGKNGFIFQSPEHSGILFRGPSFLHAAELRPGLRISTRMSVSLSPSADRLLPIVDQMLTK